MLLGNPCTDPSECYAGTKSKYSTYHYEYLYNHAFMTDQHWNQFKGSCAMGYDSDLCKERRQQLDKLFDSTNSSMYNIYDKCYKSDKVDLHNTVCVDESAIVTVLNDPGFQTALHVNQVAYKVCNDLVRSSFEGSSDGSYSIYKELIAAKKYKIVRDAL